MGLNFLTSLAKHTRIQHSKRCFTSKNSISRIWTESKSYSNNFNTNTVTKTTPCFSFLLLFRKSYSSSSSSSSSAKTQVGFLAWYLGALESRPIITKSISSAVIYAASDVTSQMITMLPSDSLDIIRTLRMAGFGLLILGTAQHLWFNFVASVLPKRDIISTLKKLLMGQLGFGPVINSIFFSFNAALQGMSFKWQNNDMSMTIKSRKLQDNGYGPSTNEGDSSKLGLEDYRPIDPVPSSKASIRAGPVEHGTPLMPYIPKPSPPPISNNDGLP